MMNKFHGNLVFLCRIGGSLKVNGLELQQGILILSIMTLKVTSYFSEILLEFQIENVFNYFPISLLPCQEHFQYDPSQFHFTFHYGKNIHEYIHYQASLYLN